MYEEGHRSFALKNIILKLLLIVVIVFLIIWLFPTKNYVKNIIDQKLGTGSTQIFNNNINTMKDAATSYFSGNRLPNKIGDSKKLTLKEMLDKNLLVEFTDSKGKKCDIKRSYATVTKNKSDYSLKVNLVCSDKKASINSYISENLSCTNDVCSKKKLTENNESKEADNNNSQAKNCEYTKNTNGYWTNYGAWSDWNTTAVSASNSRQVETKTDKVETGTIVEQDGYKKHTQEPKKVLVTKNNTKYLIYVCPSDFDNGGTYKDYVTCVKTMPNYVTKKTYKNITYYRYRDRKYINSGADIKWSTCNDKALINAGYKNTGSTK